MPDTAINILWTIGVGTIVLLMLAVGFIMAIVQSKRREIIAKQRELEELTKREAKYRNLFENSLAGMVRLSSNSWNILEANQALLEMFGAKTSEEIKQVLDTIPATDRERILISLSEQGTIKNLETSVRRGDNTEVWISLSGSLFPQENIIECVIIDVTERKRLETKHLSTQRMESIGVLASGIAHDLKNLLVPVKLAVELLKRKIPDAHAQKTLTSIGDSAEHSIDLAQHVLSFVRGVEGHHVPLQASELLRRVLYAVQETLPNNIEVISAIPNIPTMIPGEAGQLRQVLVNLINNAKDAMPDGGYLTASQKEMWVDKATADIIPNASSGFFVIWSISDTGIGIPLEKIEKIFEPFYTTKEISKGTGLGLSIVAGIVKGHNGFISVDSEVGKGTTFNIYLPVIQEPQ